VLIELVSERYERKRLAVTANTPFWKWGEVFLDAAITVAAVDRLVYHATILKMDRSTW
jgi:DNA replication protein DnaC